MAPGRRRARGRRPHARNHAPAAVKGAGEDAPGAHEPRVAPDIDVVRSGHFVEVHQGIAKRLTSGRHRRRPLVVVETDDGVAVRQPDGNNQTMLAGYVSNEVDFAMNVKLLEHRSKRIDPGSSLQASDVRRDVEIGRGTRRVRRSWCGPLRQAVHQVEHADREDQDEGTEKQTAVQMEVAGEDIIASHQEKCRSK